MTTTAFDDQFTPEPSTASVYATASAADYAATNDERAKQAEYLRKHFPE